MSIFASLNIMNPIANQTFTVRFIERFQTSNGTYNITGIFFIFHKGVVKPNKLFVLSHH